ncbi:hypothetical protein SAMN04488009_1001 [Maribacter sedimenticola]|uniref:Lipocalin-like domain-containing protein n=1 Tax=Maribacter sedimenticola TaxID=228956 RepID=A0ABY1SE25_9FLAO|nr:hypothetical protein [Maribacter sedimenticola]SNR29867.1 hypothetical protein SAMN04488009_1001 [Maribacter sedimenticola]
MKKFFSYTMYIGLLAMALNLTSCQDEFEEINNGEEPQAIEANSSTADLIQRTSSNDGSSDNIVDGTSCFQIKFPYTVEVNGLTLTIESKDDLETIEEIFDSIDDDENILDIIFPITVTAGDFTEITVNGLQDLRELAAECKEGGEDDDIECIDFVYPMTLYTFNVNLEQTSTVQVESDRELRLFFKDLGSDSLVSFDFPITLKLYDDTTIEVANHRELASAIENAKDDCDEDDDDDYNDDDFNDDEFKETLVECVWFITEFKRDNMDQTPQFVNYILNFKEDGTVVTGFRGATTVQGTWSTAVGEDGAQLTMDFDASTDFNLEWNVYDMGDDKIKLYNGEGNRIVMKQFCAEDLPVITIDSIRETLRDCTWAIKRVKNNGEHVNRLLGSEFEFQANGVITLSNETTVSEGTWEITTNAQGRFVVAINMGQEGAVSFEWLLTDLKDRIIKFNVEETFYELVIVKSCEVDEEEEEDITYIKDVFSDTQWDIALFSENEDESTELYMNDTLYFNADGSLEVRNPNEVVLSTGRWFAYRNAFSGKLEMIISFVPGSNYLALANDYQIMEVTETRIELKHENEIEGYDHLVLERE